MNHTCATCTHFLKKSLKNGWCKFYPGVSVLNTQTGKIEAKYINVSVYHQCSKHLAK